MADYNSVHSGQEIDSAVSAVKQKQSTWDGKLDASQKGAAGGVASLDTSGKVPSAQLPSMNYDPVGSAQAVQGNLDSHTGNKSNPHGVTAAQVGAIPTSQKGAAGGVATLGSDGKVPSEQAPTAGAENVSIPAATAEALGVEDATPTVDDALNKLGKKSEFKVGDILTTVRNDLDDTWLLCNGEAVDRNTNPELFNLIVRNTLPDASNINETPISFGGQNKRRLNEHVLAVYNTSTSSGEYHPIQFFDTRDESIVSVNKSWRRVYSVGYCNGRYIIRGYTYISSWIDYVWVCQDDRITSSSTWNRYEIAKINSLNPPAGPVYYFDGQYIMFSVEQNIITAARTLTIWHTDDLSSSTWSRKVLFTAQTSGTNINPIGVVNSELVFSTNNSDDGTRAIYTLTSLNSSAVKHSFTPSSTYLPSSDDELVYDNDYGIYIATETSNLYVAYSVSLDGPWTTISISGSNYKGAVWDNNLKKLICIVKRAGDDGYDDLFLCVRDLYSGSEGLVQISGHDYKDGAEFNMDTGSYFLYYTDQTTENGYYVDDYRITRLPADRLPSVAPGGAYAYIKAKE